MNIIADIGSNWKVGSMQDSKARLIEMIKTAKRNGAGTVKLQLFKADLLWRDPQKVNSLKGYEFPETWLNEAKDVATSVGLEFLVTPFYTGAVDVLDGLVTRYKVASTDLTYTPLLQRIAETKRPVILSVGGATHDELLDALEILRPDLRVGVTDMENPPSDSSDIALMHCVPSYPPPTNELNLREILDLGMRCYPLRVGFSSHYVDPYITASTVMLGVEEIEVHFDLGDGMGVETRHSYSPEMLSKLVKYCDLFKRALSCNCPQGTFSNENARMHSFRDSSDWLRPPIKAK